MLSATHKIMVSSVKLDDIIEGMKFQSSVSNMDKILYHTVWLHCDTEQALVEKMVVGDEIVNILFKDPLLPEVFLPEEWKGKELRQGFIEWDNEVTNISRPYFWRIFK